MFVLQLNPMRSNAENVVPVARAETREVLLDFLRREAVESYISDNQWRKCFRQGGPLEWFNDPGPHMEPWIGVPAIVDVGTRDDWMRRAGERYDREMASIFAV
jgi:hypothetical protein